MQHIALTLTYSRSEIIQGALPLASKVIIYLFELKFEKEVCNLSVQVLLSSNKIQKYLLDSNIVLRIQTLTVTLQLMDQQSCNLGGRYAIKKSNAIKYGPTLVPNVLLEFPVLNLMKVSQLVHFKLLEDVHFKLLIWKE